MRRKSEKVGWENSQKALYVYVKLSKNTEYKWINKNNAKIGSKTNSNLIKYLSENLSLKQLKGKHKEKSLEEKTLSRPFLKEFHYHKKVLKEMKNETMWKGNTAKEAINRVWPILAYRPGESFANSIPDRWTSGIYNHCGGLNKNAPHRLMCLMLGSGAVWKD